MRHRKLLALLLAFAGAVRCSGHPDRARTDAPRGRTEYRSAIVPRKDIANVLRRRAPALMAIEGVSGTGEEPRPTRRSLGAGEGHGHGRDDDAEEDDRHDVRPGPTRRGQRQRPQDPLERGSIPDRAPSAPGKAQDPGRSGNRLPMA